MAIADLMTGWIHRDLEEWDLLRELFTPEGRIEVSWFSGPAADFVDASARMGASDIRTKHVITSPIVRFSADGSRAISETNAIVVAENGALQLGAQAHTRFLDRLEHRDGRWRIADRRAVYDFASFTFALGPIEIDRAAVARFPIEYGALAHVLSSGGFPVEGRYPVRGGAEERRIKERAAAWIQEQRA